MSVEGRKAGGSGVLVVWVCDCAAFFVLCGFLYLVRVLCRVRGPHWGPNPEKIWPRRGGGPEGYVWALGLSCETPAASELQTHLWAPALQTPPKFHGKTPRERQKRAKMGAGEEKKAQNFGRSRVEWPNAGGVRRRGRTGGSKTNNHTTPTPNTNTQQQHTTTTHEQQHTNKNTQTTYNHNNHTSPWIGKKKRIGQNVRGVSWSDVTTVPKRKSHRGLDLDLSLNAEVNIWKGWKENGGTK